RLSGEPFPLAGNIQRALGKAVPFSASENGVVVYGTAVSPDVQLAWYDRHGMRLGPIGEPGPFAFLSMSPDEERRAVSRANPETKKLNIWTMELSTGLLSRVTFNTADDWTPVWSRDGRELMFSSDRAGTWDLYRTLVAGGAAENRVVASNDLPGPLP